MSFASSWEDKDHDPIPSEDVKVEVANDNRRRATGGSVRLVPDGDTTTIKVLPDRGRAASESNDTRICFVCYSYSEELDDLIDNSTLRASAGMLHGTIFGDGRKRPNRTCVVSTDRSTQTDKGYSLLYLLLVECKHIEIYTYGDRTDRCDPLVEYLAQVLATVRHANSMNVRLMEIRPIDIDNICRILSHQNVVDVSVNRWRQSASSMVDYITDGMLVRIFRDIAANTSIESASINMAVPERPVNNIQADIISTFLRNATSLRHLNLSGEISQENVYELHALETITQNATNLTSLTLEVVATSADAKCRALRELIRRNTTLHRIHVQLYTADDQFQGEDDQFQGEDDLCSALMNSHGNLVEFDVTFAGFLRAHTVGVDAHFAAFGTMLTRHPHLRVFTMSCRHHILEHADEHTLDPFISAVNENRELEWLDIDMHTYDDVDFERQLKQNLVDAYNAKAPGTTRLEGIGTAIGAFPAMDVKRAARAARQPLLHFLSADHEIVTGRAHPFFTDRNADRLLMGITSEYLGNDIRRDDIQL
jgi:hypothetical protein